MQESPNTHDFADRNIVVTGGAGGIGLAIAKYFAARAGRVYVLDIQDQLQEDVGADIAERIFLLPTDLRDANSIASAFEHLSRQMEALHVLVNNAGVPDGYLIGSLPLDVWRTVMDVNLTAPFLCLQQALSLLRKAGSASVINIASIAGKRMSYSGGVAYTASKAGLLGFTRHAAFELARDRIRVNAVCPGLTLTPLILNTTTPLERKRAVDTIPLGSMISPGSIARAVGFLASDDSDMCTGTSIDVDGGLLVSNGVSPEAYFARRRG